MNRWVKALWNRSRGRLPSYFRSEEQLREILRRERSRADRGGMTMCLLTLRLVHAHETRGGFQTLAEVLEGRLRQTDEAGFLSRGVVGVVLPDTSPAGGRTVADDLGRLARVAGAPVRCNVSVYPAENESESLPQPTTQRRGRKPARIVHSMDAVFVEPMPLSKRCLDIAGAIVGIILLAPLLLAVAAAVRWTSPGPILFRQKRAGLGGRPFMMLKFRSMCDKADNQQDKLRSFSQQDGPAFKLADDPRVTPLGRFLRTTSIDELPQLWNVLRGEMSLVGPRPLPCHETHGCEPWQKQRLDVTPGLTCLWQVRGRSRVSFDEWMRMDCQYVRSRGFLTDVRILLETVPAVLLRRGAC